jgi:hypothetical protein
LRQFPFSIYINYFKLLKWFYALRHLQNHIAMMLMTCFSELFCAVTPRVLQRSRPVASPPWTKVSTVGEGMLRSAWCHHSCSPFVFVIRIEIHHGLVKSHYYTNDFARRCPFIKGTGHKIQPPRLIPAINGGGHFLFTEIDTFDRLGK